jgi:regulator of nucleoside diphosphate kinase
MSTARLPPVCIPRSDYVRLERLATRANSERHPIAAFLLSEIRRARVFEPRGRGNAVVSLNKWVTYRLDGGPSECRILVHPEDYLSPARQLSVLSPLGAALIGLRIGDRMPYSDELGLSHVVTPVSLDPPPFGPAPTCVPEDPGDGPQAA